MEIEGGGKSVRKSKRQEMNRVRKGQEKSIAEERGMREVKNERDKVKR